MANIIWDSQYYYVCLKRMDQNLKKRRVFLLGFEQNVPTNDYLFIHAKEMVARVLMVRLRNNREILAFTLIQSK